MLKPVKIIECPRDAMQGIKEWIPTSHKVRYLQSLLQVGFDTLDFGSFVSPKAIPQMQDTAEVLNRLDISQTQTKLLAIVANERGAREASSFEKIRYLGYPFSISEHFQMRNTGKTIAQSEELLKEILEITLRKNKELVVYISMGFGNPYGELWDVDLVAHWTQKVVDMGVKIVSLSDTIGSATPQNIEYLFQNLIPQFPHIEFGAHLHTHPQKWMEKVEAAYKGGCCRFDGAIRGFGGCPMAKDELTGNMPTEKLLTYFTAKNVPIGLNSLQFESAYNEALQIFSLKK